MEIEDQANREVTENPPSDEEDFLERLRSFPNLFFQDCAKRATKARLRSTLRTIENQQQRREDNDPADLQDEENPKNIVTFLQWTLGHVQEAEEMAAREVRERPSNILALSNSAYILWQKRMNGEAWKRLEKLEALRAGDPEQYDNLDMEAQSEILYLYIKLGHLFKPYAISNLQEELLTRRPHDDSLKYTLGLTLRRYTNFFCTSKHPKVDFAPAVRRAIELFVQIKNREENSLDLRAKAAAELGEILSWQQDEHIRKAVEEMQRRLRLTTADQCFDEALRLAPNNPPVLVRAGKHFRYQKKMTKSRQLLEKAVRLRPEPKAHHQLGITLKQLAFQEQSNRRHQASNPQAAGATVRLSRDGRYVQEAMEHFRQSLELSDGENDLALHDLGLMHSALGGYEEALQQFRKILELVSSFRFNEAMEQAGLVLAEMAKGERDCGRREALEKMSQLCLNLTLSNQCHQLETTRLKEVFWVSFHSLQEPLRHLRYKELRENTGKEEGALLKMAKAHSRTLPVLRDLLNYSEMRAIDANVLEGAVQDYLTEGRYDDALLFLSLLKLTQQSRVLGTWRDADVYVRVHVLVAKDRLLSCVGRNDVVSDLNVTVAKMMFRQAFQDFLSSEHSRQGQADDRRGDNRSNENETPRPSQDPLPPTTSPSQAAAIAGEIFADDSSPELDDDVSDALNVLLLYDRRDREAERDVRNLQTMLQEICGLTAALMCDDEAPLSAGRSALEATAKKAELLVCVVRSADVSPEFSTWIEAAVNTTIARRLVTLVLNSSPLPPDLQGHRFFSVSSSELLDLDQGREPRSADGVRATCKLFCGLIGLQM